MSQLAVGDVARIGVGCVVLAYVTYCVLNQKVWIRKGFSGSWKPRDEYSKSYTLTFAGGTVIGIWMILLALHNIMTL